MIRIGYGMDVHRLVEILRRLSEGGNYNIGSATLLGNISSVAVTHRYCGITRNLLLHHKACNRLAYDITATQNNTLFALSIDIISAQKFHNAIGGSRQEAGKPNRETACVYRVKTIDILAIVNRFGYLLLVDVTR